jgi:hypothetical protein
MSGIITGLVLTCCLIFDRNFGFIRKHAACITSNIQFDFIRYADSSNYHGCCYIRACKYLTLTYFYLIAVTLNLSLNTNFFFPFPAAAFAELANIGRLSNRACMDLYPTFANHFEFH